VNGEAAAQLRDVGVALLRSCVAVDSLSRMREAAVRCFAVAEARGPASERLGFNHFSHSVPLKALVEFGCDWEELLRPLSAPGIESLIAQTMGVGWDCGIEQSWLRKKFVPLEAPATQYRIQDWHQDGALGVQFPTQPSTPNEPKIPMTELLTVWIPLDACGRESPGPGVCSWSSAGPIAFL
jgi:hypothetical protein